jgi:hypothetical protein
MKTTTLFFLKSKSISILYGLQRNLFCVFYKSNLRKKNRQNVHDITKHLSLKRVQATEKKMYHLFVNEKPTILKTFHFHPNLATNHYKRRDI